jgi:hypothetical protein
MVNLDKDKKAIEMGIKGNKYYNGGCAKTCCQNQSCTWERVMSHCKLGMIFPGSEWFALHCVVLVMVCNPVRR